MNYLDFLIHYGVSKLNGAPGPGSGRYPLGSGENPNQRSMSFVDRVNAYKKEGLTEKEIANALSLSTTQLRVQYSQAKHAERAEKAAIARKLRDEGYSLNEIARKMGYANDSSVRSLLNENTLARKNAAQTTADYLKAVVDEKGMVDVGVGVEKELNYISREKLKEALYILEQEGYPTYGVGIPQPTNPGQQTNTKILCPPGTPYKDAYDFENVHSVKEYSKILTEDGTKIRPAFEYPTSLDSSRFMVKYAEEGGVDKDGLIELRRGVEDISLGDSTYAQVRILVDGTHYIKGMAVYSDNLPDGVDVLFNTNKHEGTPVMGPKDNSVLKPIDSDPDNPFGSLIKERGGQRYYDDPNGNYIDPITGHKQSLSVINKRADEGDWDNWSHTLPSQMLSKQSEQLINKQLNLAIADKKAEYEEICALTNPTVKKKLLQSYSDDCDAAAIDLKAAALPRQRYQVIIPGTTVGDNYIYAPNYRDGEKVALVRFPHESTSQIPILTVNNKLEEGKRVLGNNPTDAVMISAKTAARMSGADFDGDTVMVIPTNSNVKIISKPALKLGRDGTEDYDPKMEYGPDPTKEKQSYKRLSKDATQIEMGKISNLITDMTLQGANDKELTRAIRHSMVVIDANKHNLDWQRSEKENGIAELRKKYQSKDDEGRGGASTIISRASSPEYVTKRQGTPRVNQPGKPWYDPSRPNGVLLYKDTDHPYYINKKGKDVKLTQQSTRMAETDDPYTLVSKAQHPKELAYAHYAAQMKAFANQARMTMVNTPDIKYNASAKKVYQKEVDSLEAKLNRAELNAPRERQALILANAAIKAKTQTYPELKDNEHKSELKKLRQRELIAARTKVGAERHPVDITEREWEAIQSGAVSPSKLQRILNHADIDQVRQYATPRTTNTLTEGKKARIHALKSSGYTNAEIADALGISTSTVSRQLKGD